MAETMLHTPILEDAPATGVPASRPTKRKRPTKLDLKRRQTETVDTRAIPAPSEYTIPVPVPNSDVEVKFVVRTCTRSSDGIEIHLSVGSDKKNKGVADYATWLAAASLLDVVGEARENILRGLKPALKRQRRIHLPQEPPIPNATTTTGAPPTPSSPPPSHRTLREAVDRLIF